MSITVKRLNPTVRPTPSPLVSNPFPLSVKSSRYTWRARIPTGSQKHSPTRNLLSPYQPTVPLPSHDLCTFPLSHLRQLTKILVTKSPLWCFDTTLTSSARAAEDISKFNLSERRATSVVVYLRARPSLAITGFARARALLTVLFTSRAAVSRAYMTKSIREKSIFAFSKVGKNFFQCTHRWAWGFSYCLSHIF